jgi:hypothetical protein
LKFESRCQQPSRNNATAFNNQFCFGADKKRADFKHPFRRGQAEWREAVERHVKNIDYQDTFESGVVTGIGWIEEVQGFNAGYDAGTERIKQLVHIYGKQKVSEYLQQFKLPQEKVVGSFGFSGRFGTFPLALRRFGMKLRHAGRYSPAEVVKAERTVISGMPDVSRITTSHVEKQNHTLRMHCRRLTRLTNAFSKKFENFEAAIALNFAYYNFCKTHGAIRMTPAMAAGIEKSHWTVAELVKNCGE